MPDKVRWAILGAGKIARSFVNDFPAINNAKLVAVASGDENRGQAFAKEFNIPFAYSYNELYNSEEVDAVYIATTHNFHYEQCLECLRHGKHVLCEKPITINDTQFKELATVAKSNNVFLMEAMWTFFLPAMQKAKKWLNEGKIGKLRVIDATFGYLMEKNPEGRMYNPALAGGALLDLGIYPIAFSTFFTNAKPGKIVASGVLTDTGVDEKTGIILQYDEVTANLFTSMVNMMTNNGMLYGEKGYIEIPSFFNATSAVLYNNDHKALERFEDDRTTKGYNFEMQHATDMILEGKTESDIMPHSRSNQIQEMLTEVRQQIGVVYPGEKASRL